ncbi:hypothetical protein, partial [Salmonella sp. s60093]|uniref:hypothetical protein n=1 Tax=Salmonella sp. s60093 TaxID=3159721 RepID=UPI0039807295
MLPYTMASLDKVRFEEGALSRWLKKQSVDNHVVMEKLDGLSALYVCVTNNQGKMYLRGDGVRGVDVSRAVSCLKIPKATTTTIV